MAQLPPKIPNTTTPDSPELSNHRRHHHHHHHQRMSSLGHIHGNANSKNPCWVDEFLDFSSVKRNAHRRSASDSGGAYLDQPPGDRKNGFARFEEDHLLSMFTDEISPAAAVGPSSSSNPSDHNDEKHPPENGAEEAHVGATISNSNDRIVDPKRVKRILANRQSAQRSRVKKLQYISELERSITSLQAEVSVLSPRVAFLDHQRLLLNVDNSALKQRIAALQQDKIFKDAHQEALKREIERLRQVYQRQNLNNVENPTFDSKQPQNETELMLNV